MQYSNGCLWNRFTSVQVTMAWCTVDCGDSDSSLCLLSCKSITLITEKMDKMTHTYLHNSYLWTQKFRIKNIQSMFTRNPELQECINIVQLNICKVSKLISCLMEYMSNSLIFIFLFDAEHYNGCLWNRFMSVQVTMAWFIVDCSHSDSSLCLLSCKSITLITEMMDKMTNPSPQFPWHCTLVFLMFF